MVTDVFVLQWQQSCCFIVFAPSYQKMDGTQVDPCCSTGENASYFVRSVRAKRAAASALCAVKLGP